MRGRTLAVVADPLSDRAAAILAHFTAKLTVAGYTWDRRLIADGSTAFDCEQLAVEGMPVFLGGSTATPPLPPPLVNMGGLGTSWRVWAVRCVPTFGEGQDPPPAAEITTSTLRLLAERWAIVQAVLTLDEPGAPFEGCDVVYVNEIAPIAPSGGLGGTVARFTVNV